MWLSFCTTCTILLAQFCLYIMPGTFKYISLFILDTPIMGGHSLAVQYGPPLLGPVLLKEGNWSTLRKPAVFDKVKLDNIHLTCNQDNFNYITPWSWNQTLVKVTRDTCTATEPPTPKLTFPRNSRSGDTSHQPH